MRVTASMLYERWQAHQRLLVAACSLSENAAKAYRYGARKYLDWCAAARLAPNLPDTILAWKADLLAGEYKPGTVNTWYAGIRAMFAWAAIEGLVSQDPCQFVKPEKRSRAHRREALTDEEARRLLAIVDPGSPAGARDAAILELMLYTGIRSVEVHRADLEDLRTDTGQLVLRIQGKGRRETDEVAVITHPGARSALYAWLAVRGDDPGPLFTSASFRDPGGRLSLSWIRRMVKGYMRAAGIVSKLKTTHSLRHSAISNYVRRTKNVVGAQRLARHASIETTMIYVSEANRLTDPPEAYIDYGEEADAGKT